jgi:hypothetical protein
MIGDIATFGTWWDQSRITLGELEASRDSARRILNGFLLELGYQS